MAAASRRCPSTFALVGATGKWNVRRRRDGDVPRGVRRGRHGATAGASRGACAGDTAPPPGRLGRHRHTVMRGRHGATAGASRQTPPGDRRRVFRHSQGDGAGATGTRGDRGRTTPSIGRRSVGEADVRVSSTEAWPGVTVILGPHIRGSPRRRAGRESAGHGGWCPGPVTPCRRDARPLPRVPPHPAGGDDPLETGARRQGPTPRPQAAAHHFGRHPLRVPA